MCQPHGVCSLEGELRPATGAIGTLAPTSVREIGSSVGSCPRGSISLAFTAAMAGPIFPRCRGPSIQAAPGAMERSKALNTLVAKLLKMYR